MNLERKSSRFARFGTLALCLGLLPLLGVATGGWIGPGPAAADVLVLQDGSKIQTDGPWEVKGRQIVFTRPDGTLSSIRTAEVDLEASEQATAEAQEEARRHVAEENSEAEKELERDGGEERREATWKLTDADFSRRRPASPAGGGEGSEEEAEEGQPAQPDAPPVVVDHRREEDPLDQHVVIAGTVANRTSTTATAVAVRVVLFNESGDVIGETSAQMERSALPPGEQTTFRAPFPGVFNYASLRFQTSSTNLETARPGEGGEGGEGADGQPAAGGDAESGEAASEG